jgi:hypothetical protein
VLVLLVLQQISAVSLQDNKEVDEWLELLDVLPFKEMSNNAWVAAPFVCTTLSPFLCRGQSFL